MRADSLNLVKCWKGLDCLDWLVLPVCFQISDCDKILFNSGWTCDCLTFFFTALFRISSVLTCILLGKLHLLGDHLPCIHRISLVTWNAGVVQTFIFSYQLNQRSRVNFNFPSLCHSSGSSINILSCKLVGLLAAFSTWAFTACLLTTQWCTEVYCIGFTEFCCGGKIHFTQKHFIIVFSHTVSWLVVKKINNLYCKRAHHSP